MRRPIAMLLIAAFAQVLFLQEIVSAEQRDKYSLAVLNVSVNDMQFGRPEVTSLTNLLTGALDESGHFYTMSQGNMESTLISRGMNPDGCITLDCAVRAGKTLGVQLVVSWSVTRSSEGFRIEANMIHTGSQVVVKTVRAGVLGGLPNLKASMSYLADELMGRKRARKIERSATPSRTADRPASRPAPVSQPSYRSGDAGFNWMYVGLGALVAGGVGVGVLLIQNGSGGDTGPGNSGPGTGQLPGPPTFP